MAGAAKRIEREQLFSEVNAWLCARLTMTGFHNPKKFPEFRDVSAVKVRRQRQGWEQQKSIALALNAAFGGKVTGLNE